SNNFGQITIPPGATNVVAITAGFNHSLVLRADGTVIAWGDNSVGQCNVPSNLAGVVAIAAGYYQSLALKSDGHITAWGTNHLVVTGPNSASGIVGIAANRDNSYGLTINGTILAWGSDGTRTNPVNALRIFSASSDVLYIKTNGLLKYQNFDIASTSDGCVFDAWVKTDGTVTTPSGNNVPLGLRAVDIAVAYGTYAAIRGDGTVAVWVEYWGRPDSQFYQPVPAVLTNPPPRLRNVISVKGGYGHFLALELPSPPIPSVAKASAQVVNGFVVGLNVLDGGEGYAVPPKVTISGGGGSGATAMAQISKGIVTGFTITNAGIGYTGTPTVTIDPPPFLPKLSIATSRVGVTMQVVPGKRYQLESSNDLPNFGPVGAPFVADKDTITQEFIVSETGQFFRIVEAP
ncbi:MAG TPA: hypothetical protein VM260_08670, partial [Pirellula sp.]|nr:hypothetical protein [Pirellula sp.]